MEKDPSQVANWKPPKGKHVTKEFSAEGGRREGLSMINHHHTGEMKPTRPFHFGNGKCRLGKDCWDSHQRADELEADVSRKLEHVFMGSQK